MLKERNQIGTQIREEQVPRYGLERHRTMKRQGQWGRKGRENKRERESEVVNCLSLQTKSLPDLQPISFLAKSMTSRFILNPNSEKWDWEREKKRNNLAQNLSFVPKSTFPLSKACQQDQCDQIGLKLGYFVLRRLVTLNRTDWWMGE